jgi:hypothetical protein
VSCQMIFLTNFLAVVDKNPGGYECPTHRFYW